MARLGVVGAGTMGSGIAQVFTQAGHSVILCDAHEKVLERSMASIDKGLDRLVKKAAIKEDDKKAALSRIECTTSFDKFSGADLVVEAVIENVGVKKDIFSKLDTIVKPDSVLASNTSSISITELAAVTKRPGKVIGMHFMNPVPVMKLVEVVRGLETEDGTVEKILSLCRELNKTAVIVNDYPGFVSNRVLMPMINEAVYTLMEGVGTKEAIDTVMKLGMNHPMGPLELADLIGLDVCLDIMEVLYREFSDSKYRPCPLLRKMVRAGHLGRKSGRGFYSY